jgi:ABC-type transport system involved in multi-copper enzyme maturation permease subunit
MTWLVWRQHRKQLLFGLAGIAAIAAFLVPTGISMHERFTALKLPGCLSALMAKALVAPNDTCFHSAETFFNGYQMAILVGLILMILPMLVGMFWGAPLVAREVELGTHRLVWTQGVSRARWAIAKFGWITAGVLVLTAIYAAIYTWWITPVVDTSRQQFGYIFFDAHGFVVFGYVLFALALGILAGAIAQRLLPAMAATFVGFVGMRLFVMLVARPRFLAVQHRRTLLATRNDFHGDWIMGQTLHKADGSRLVENTMTICKEGSRGCADTASGAYAQQDFHPASHFWIFQSIETAIFVALAIALVVLAIYWVRKKIA